MAVNVVSLLKILMFPARQKLFYQRKCLLLLHNSRRKTVKPVVYLPTEEKWKMCNYTIPHRCAETVEIQKVLLKLCL